MKPLCIDLFAGLGGWTDGFLAEGWNVVGFDIERHRYPARAVPECDGVKAAGEKVKLGASREKGNSRSGSFNYANECALKESPLTGGWAEYPAQLVLQDVLMESVERPEQLEGGKGSEGQVGIGRARQSAV